jgi:hypothetical protein
MKKMMNLIVLVIVLCSAPINGQGPKMNWQTVMDSVSGGYASIVITKNNNYIINSNNGNNIYNTTCLDNQGKALWKIQDSISQVIDMNGQDNFIGINSNSKTFTIYDYNGNAIKTIASPKEAADFNWIYAHNACKDDHHYYIVYLDNTTRWSIFIFDNELNFVSTFPLPSGAANVYGVAPKDGYIYVSTSGSGVGGYSSAVSDLYKYDMKGNIIWQKHFLDKSAMNIALSPDGNLYIGSMNTNLKNSNPGTKAWLSWGFSKIDTNGNTIWDKSWWDEYPDSVPVASWVHDFKAIPGGGCVIAGSTTRLGMGGVPDPNNIEPTMVAFSDSGEQLWENRYSYAVNEYASFSQIAWDKQNYLIAAAWILNTDWYQTSMKYFVDGVTAVKKENSGLPTSFSLSQNYPNPFNPTTTINFSIVKSGLVTLKVYDLLGREVSTLINEEVKTGNYSVKFDGSKLASGVYVYVLKTADFTSSKKMLLVK